MHVCMYHLSVWLVGCLPACLSVCLSIYLSIIVFSENLESHKRETPSMNMECVLRTEWMKVNSCPKFFQVPGITLEMAFKKFSNVFID